LYSYGCGYSYAVSPNPVSDLLTISNYEADDLVDATLVDQSNQVTKRGVKADNKTEIDVSELSDGLYVLKVRFKKRIETSNIIVSHQN
jgi:hypothetical protein